MKGIQLPSNFQKDLEKIISLPIWKAENSLGSMAIIEFGTPHLVSYEMKNMKLKSGELKKKVRRIHAVGEYSLHIWHCDWKVHDGERHVGGSGSKKDVQTGLRALQGQFVKRVYVSPSGSETIIGGDLNILLSINPADQMENHWTLYKNTGMKWAIFPSKKGKLEKEIIKQSSTKKLVW